jgi:hypothetical protein
MGCFTLKTRHLTQSVYVGGCELHPFVVGGRGEEVFGIVNRRCLPRSIVVHVISLSVCMSNHHGPNCIERRRIREATRSCDFVYSDFMLSKHSYLFSNLTFIQYFKLLAFTLCSGSIGFWN